MEEKVLDYKLTIKHSRLLEILLKYKVRRSFPRLEGFPRMELWSNDLYGPGVAILITEIGAHLISENLGEDNSNWRKICKDYGL